MLACSHMVCCRVLIWHGLLITGEIDVRCHLQRLAEQRERDTRLGKIHGCGNINTNDNHSSVSSGVGIGTGDGTGTGTDGNSDGDEYGNGITDSIADHVAAMATLAGHGSIAAFARCAGEIVKAR